jgi:hypothetical protein
VALSKVLNTSRSLALCKRNLQRLRQQCLATMRMVNWSLSVDRQEDKHKGRQFFRHVLLGIKHLHSQYTPHMKYGGKAPECSCTHIHTQISLCWNTGLSRKPHHGSRPHNWYWKLTYPKHRISFPQQAMGLWKAVWLLAAEPVVSAQICQPTMKYEPSAACPHRPRLCL